MPIGTRTIRHLNKGYVCMYVCIILFQENISLCCKWSCLRSVKTLTGELIIIIIIIIIIVIVIIIIIVIVIVIIIIIVIVIIIINDNLHSALSKSSKALHNQSKK